MNFGGNFPKLGHVNAVCKEWTVREDCALAHTLQSQEINKYYEGNKFRNAIVRQDFPTALNEQRKENEAAEKQNALCNISLCEQEEADKMYAEEVARSLEKNYKERLRENYMSEKIAKQLQNIYISEVQSNKYSALEDIELERKYSNEKSVFLIQNHNTEHIELNIVSHHDCQPHETCQLIGDKSEQVRQTDVADSIKYYELNLLKKQDMPLTKVRSKNSPSDSCLKEWTENKSIFAGNNLLTRNNCQQLQKEVNLNSFGQTLNDEIDPVELKSYQEKKDEELARHLQQLDQRKPLTQEEKDRILAIEAQDKELAHMLQERERIKADKAKAKARLKKNQQKFQDAGECPAHNNSLPYEHEAYANPIDLIPQSTYPARTEEAFIVDADNRGSEIYTLPIDTAYTSLDSRRKNNKEQLICISSSEKSDLNDVKLSGSAPFGDQKSGPVPPYMPIQSNNSNAHGKKKTYKDRCAHQ